ncbi:uncharacterized protein LOC128740817 [Sabethes cyaneus]|uniref:uncharacterized protein LOC128740817 n=1 Tax=Sabethes cyaneus TaxID=53552 RepID=UPI00237E7825|nr:uncharacterized protein LOC128740817 [Sabethes cyaneus]
MPGRGSDKSLSKATDKSGGASGGKKSDPEESVVEVNTTERAKSTARRALTDDRCQVCEGPETNQMVQCDECDVWCHFSCVGVTQQVEDQSWICMKCQSAKIQQSILTASRNRLQPPAVSKEAAGSKLSVHDQQSNTAGVKTKPRIVVIPEDGSTNAKRLEQVSKLSHRSSRSILKLQLMQLEEKRAFEEQEARKHREYMKEKYKLLEQMTEKSVSGSSVSERRVENWVDKVNIAMEDLAFDPAGHSTTNHADPSHQKFTHGRESGEIHPRPDNPNSTPLYGFRTPPIASSACDNAPPVAPPTVLPIAPPGARSVILPVAPALFPPRKSDPYLYSQSTTLHELSKQQIAARQAIPRDLPTFSGNSEEWPVFISMFHSTTAMCGYSHEENIIRLQKSLRGKAYDAVNSRLMHPSNVPGVLKTLQMLYGQPEAIVHSLIRKISALPAIREDKPETLVDFAVNVQNFCATVDACSLEEYMYNVTLLHQLVNKLPPSIKLDWARYRHNLPRVNLATFGEWMYSLAEAASTLTIPPLVQDVKSLYGESKSTKKTNTFLHSHSEPHTMDHSQAANPSTSNVKPKTYIDTCPVCNGSCKTASSCNRFLSFSRDSRWAAVREFELCRRCLRRQHGKCTARPCGKDGCSYFHHELLHNDKKPQLYTNTPSQESSQSLNEGSAEGCNTHHFAPNAVLFKYLPVILQGKDSAVHVYAFLDEGSAVTLLDQEIANQLKLEGNINPLNLRWTGGTERYENNSRTVDVKISGIQNEAKQYNLSGVRTVKELLLPYQSLSMTEMTHRYTHLRNLPIQSYNNIRPQILIGLKHASVSLVLKSKEGTLDQPIGVKTRLGWTICGGCSSSNDSHFAHYAFHVYDSSSQADETLNQTVKDYFALDSLGITRADDTLLSTEDQRALSLLQSRTTFKGSRYETGLLWRHDNIRLPNNKDMALRRFHCLEKRLQKDPELAKTLQEKMSDYLSKGYARKLTEMELHTVYSRTWYLPVFPVININKPGKVRLVWDAASTAFGVSLNSTLIKGPDQLRSLFAILLQFREHQIGLTGDIKEMFHQVLINPLDQQCQRFLWRDDNGIIQTYVMNVMTFGASCSPACAQYVKNINADRFAGELPEAVDVIKNRHYVDDAMLSIETPARAIQLAQEIRRIHAAGGFEIRNWVSNSPEVLATLQQSGSVEKNLDLFTGALATEKVLGMWWCTASDKFVYRIGWQRYDVDLLKGRRHPTKREMLRVLMSIFDPLGLIAHFLMFLKVLLQEVWRSGIQWDDEINDSLFEKWCRWLKMLPKIEQVRIPRWYHSSSIPSNCEVQLHTFVDAGENGFAAATFLRFSNSATVECSLVAAKTRVAPLKFHSIPRLELQAAIVGARLARTVTQSLAISIQRHVYWTDSRDVLSWINSDHRRFSQFVAHRVSEILDTTEAKEWLWVPTKQNVADDGTKWETNPDLGPHSRWFNGPAFLWKPESAWPVVSLKISETENELRPHLLAHFLSPEPVVDVTRFGSWKRLITTVGFCYRFLTNRECRRNRQPKVSGSPINQELRAAEAFLFRLAQHEGYTEEVALLNETSQSTAQINLLPKSSSIFKLSPWLDDCGVMRMRSRISACNYATEEAKKPVILPRFHHITTLIIQHYHTKYHHQNHETVVNELRQRFVIPRIRTQFATVRKNCQSCKNECSIPQVPYMADLPIERLTAYSHPFTHVGIDCFGPMEIVVGRRCEKRWGMIVTCLTTRAIHIELLYALSTSSCIIGLENFMARRGIPRTIRSDRGTNFIGASRELKRLNEAVHYDEIRKAFDCTETNWIFNPPLTPHMGGSWERLIRSVKKNLSAVCFSKKPSEEVLRNLLVLVENTINNRPLTHVPIDDDSSPALTPNHFLLGSSNGTKPLLPLNDSGVALRQNWRASQAMADQFWKRWVSDYLPEITRRMKWFTDVKAIALGDIVVIVDNNLPRNCWLKGRIIGTCPSKDGRVRSATVRTMNGIYERPVAKLAVLDVRREEEHASEDAGAPGGVLADPIRPTRVQRPIDRSTDRLPNRSKE